MIQPTVRKVHKFKLPGGPVPQTFHMPIPAPGSIVHVGLDGQGQSCLWALVDDVPDAPMETREFVWVGTGHAFQAADLYHVGTWVAGPYTWHLFERPQPIRKAGP